MAIVKIIKNVEEDWVSSSVGDKRARTFWKTAAAAAAPLVTGRTTAAIELHYHGLVSDLKNKLSTAVFDAITDDKLKVPVRRAKKALLPGDVPAQEVTKGRELCARSCRRSLSPSAPWR